MLRCSGRISHIQQFKQIKQFDIHRQYVKVANQQAMNQYPLTDLVTDTFFLDPFAIRQWEASESGVPLQCDQLEFIKEVQKQHNDGCGLVDGYAPFCKHVFVTNFIGAKSSIVPITDENRALIRTGYTARRPTELAVLSRWFDKDTIGDLPTAKFLDIILYSREQIIAENASMDKGQSADDIPDRPWGIISIKPQLIGTEIPMQPITMLRNALGKEQGGSGVELNAEEYKKSVDFWDKHCIAM